MLDVLTARPTMTLVLTLLGALLLAQLSRGITLLAARLTRRPRLREVHERCGWPWLATLVSWGELVAVRHAGLPDDVTGPVRHLFVLATIASVSWLIGQVLFLIEDSVLRRVRVDVRDNRGGLPGVTEGGLGDLARNTDRRVTKRELVILLKPTVIQSDANWEQDLRETRGIQKAPPGNKTPEADPLPVIKRD